MNQSLSISKKHLHQTRSHRHTHLSFNAQRLSIPKPGAIGVITTHLLLPLYAQKQLLFKFLMFKEIPLLYADFDYIIKKFLIPN